MEAALLNALYTYRTQSVKLSNNEMQAKAMPYNGKRYNRCLKKVHSRLHCVLCGWYT